MMRRPWRFRFVAERDEVAERAEARVDVVLVDRLVAVVAVRAGVERHEPKEGDAESGHLAKRSHEGGRATERDMPGTLLFLGREARRVRCLRPRSGCRARTSARRAVLGRRFPCNHR